MSNPGSNVKPQSLGSVKQYLKAMAGDFFAHELTVTECSYEVDEEPETIPALIKRLSKETLETPAHAIQEEDFCVSLWTGNLPITHLSPKPIHLYNLLRQRGRMDAEVFSLLFEAREEEWQTKRKWGSGDHSPLYGFEHDLNPYSYPGISPPPTWEYAHEVATIPLSKLGKLGSLISKRVRGF